MSNQVTTVITKSCAQAGLAFANSSYNLAGIQNPPLETTVTVGAPLVVADGIGTLSYTNLNMLYMLSDTLDCTVAFYTGTDGSTGHISPSITILAGVPYEWDVNNGTSPLGTSNCGSIKVTATAYKDGVADSTDTTTDIHFRTSLTA